MITKNEQWLRTYLKISEGIYLLTFLLSLISFIENTVNNTNAGNMLLTGLLVISFIDILLCWYSVADIRRFTVLVKLNIWVSITLSLI